MKPIRRLAPFLLAVTLLVPAAPSVGATPVKTGVDGGWIDNIVCLNGTGYRTIWVDGRAETRCFDDGYIEGGPSQPVTPSPACVPGSGAFVRPRFVNARGEQKIRNGDGSGTVIDDYVLRAYLRQAEERVRQAIATYGNERSFYWRAAYPELVALELQIRPARVPKGDQLVGTDTVWRHVQSRLSTDDNALTERTAYFADKTREATAIRDTEIELDGYYGVSWVRLVDPRGTRLNLYDRTNVDAWPTLESIGSVDGLRRAISAAFGLSSPEEVVNTYLRRKFGEPLISSFGDPFTRSPLRDAYANDTWMRNGRGELLPFLIYAVERERNANGGWFVLDPVTGAETTEPMPFRPASTRQLVDSESEFRSLLSVEGGQHTKILIAALSPNRSNVYASYEVIDLLPALKSIVARNLRIQRGEPNTLDIFDGVEKQKFYVYPALTAPNMPEAANLCGPASFALNGPPRLNPIVIDPLRDFAFDSSYAGCKTKAASSLETWKANVKLNEATLTHGDSCWVDWMIWPIPEPTFNWDVSLLQYMNPVRYQPVVTGSVGNPVMLLARRSAGDIVYRDPDTKALTPIDRQVDVPLDANTKVGFALEPSVFNFTQVGLSAEIGIPGLGGQILARVSRTTDKAIEYDFPLTFERTALEQLQRPECRDLRDAATLLRRCGIGYDPDGASNDGKGEWFYRVHLRTWYGGAFYAPEANFEFPEVRGLFYTGTSSFVAETDFIPGISNTYPDRYTQLRNYNWPGGTNSSYQSWAMAFDGVGGPRILATGSIWDRMRAKAAAIPAYTLLNGTRYPVLDVSGPSELCNTPAPIGSADTVDRSQVCVDIYVRSRQPLLDR